MSRRLRDLATVILLAVAYWLASYFVAAICSRAGVHWAQALQHLVHASRAAIPVLLSTFGAIGLVIAALPVAGILATVLRPRVVIAGLLVATPAAASMLWDAWTLWQMGLQLPTLAVVLLGADVVKTLAIPPLLALLARRWLPERP